MNIQRIGTPAPFDSNAMLEEVSRAHMVHRMARELKTVHDLKDPQQVALALRLGGFTKQQIDRHLDAAYLQETEDRRRFNTQHPTVVHEAAETIAYIAVFGLLGVLAFFCFAPDRAFAAAGEVHAMDPLHELMVWVGLGALFILGMVWCLLPPKQIEHVDDDHALGDTTGWSRRQE